jgi:hypothetical protein
MGSNPKESSVKGRREIPFSIAINVKGGNIETLMEYKHECYHD